MRYVICGTAIAFVLGTTAALPTMLEARQGRTAEAGAIPSGELNLGTVSIPRAVTADGKPLASGSYRLRLTPDHPSQVPPGQTEEYQRWVEFLRGGKVVGREVVQIVPASEIQQVAQDAPPRSGQAKVQLLKGNDYVRIWVNRGGTHYLIHLPTGVSAS
jgi:hypothetical protein